MTATRAIGCAVRRRLGSLRLGAAPRAPVRAGAAAQIFLLGLAIGCGSPGSAPAPSRAALTVIATPQLTADDLVVARVNGRAVWASCIAEQARTITSGGADERRTAALDQCVAFELLAQAAEARGDASAPEVADATRRAEVNRLVETEFERRYRTPADLGAMLDPVTKAAAAGMHVPEQRSSTFARFVVPKDAPADVDARAHMLAERLAGELRGQPGLFGVHLIEAAQRIAAGTGIQLDTADFRPARRDDLVDAYAAALYGIAEVGRSSPAFRSPWGWDVVLWTGGVAAQERSSDAVIAELFPELRRRQFLRWVNQVGKQLGVHIDVHDAAVARLDTETVP